MIRLNDGKYIIGFDDGYQLGKTANYMFENGVHSIGKAEPTILENSLFYNGEYYKVCEGRETISDDKFSDDTARILTMVAIAKELSELKITNADVVLAVGLPFSDYGRCRELLVDYYNKERHLVFSFEGVDYDIKIYKVLCAPQCYAAIAPRIVNMQNQEYIVADIGSKTVDVVFVKNGLPVESKSITIEQAMIKWMRQIQNMLKQKYGKSVNEDEIWKVILYKDSLLQVEMIQAIRNMLEDIVIRFQLELKEREYDLEYLKVIYIGGGASIVKNYIKNHASNVSYDTDLRANARGYEFLAYNRLKKEA